MMPCAALAGGSGSQKAYCVDANPDYAYGGSGTYAVVVVFNTDTCANASAVMSAAAAAPGACVGLSMIGLPIYGKLIKWLLLRSDVERVLTMLSPHPII